VSFLQKISICVFVSASTAAAAPFGRSPPFRPGGRRRRAGEAPVIFVRRQHVLPLVWLLIGVNALFCVRARLSLSAHMHGAFGQSLQNATAKEITPDL
jgi:hypothetical protein